MFRGLSLFSNVGISETFLKDCGIEILIANEIIKRRAEFYSHLYPSVDMIVGDIRDEIIFTEIIKKSKNIGIDFLIATPPCQGMSLAGKMDETDTRNELILYVIEAIKLLKPKYILLENVPQLLKTKIYLKGEWILIPELLKNELESEYYFAKQNIIKAQDYDVPQMRKRNILLLSRKDMVYKWEVPDPKKNITLRDVLYDIPSVDPYLKEGLEETLKLFPDFINKKNEAEKVSPYHKPPTHSKKHAITMMHTPSGKTAFDNIHYFPKKDNGDKVNGHYNTYRRFDWDKPARTITQNNGVISSLCCVHPGKKIETRENEILYTDPRVLTIFELLIVFSLPQNWPIPSWADDKLIRNVIGEGIPPMLVKNLALELQKNYVPS